MFKSSSVSRMLLVVGASLATATAPTANETFHVVYDKLVQLSDPDEMSTWSLWAAIVCLLVLIWNLCHANRMSESWGMTIVQSTPQGRSWPYLGHALTFLKYRPWDLLQQWHVLYGPLVGFPLLGVRMFSIGSPELIKVVLQSQIACVKKDIANTYKPFLSILGTGIVTSEDEAWLKQRLKMSHPLRRDVLEIIPRQTLLAVQRFMETLDAACDSGAAVPVGSSLRHLTLQVISGTFLSLSAEESDSTFAKLYLPIVDESNIRVWHPYRAYLFFLPSFWKYIFNVRRLNRYVSGLIRRRWDLRQQERSDPNVTRQEDILDGLLAAYEKEFPEATVLPNAAVCQFRDELKTFMLAGHETSAAMMTWAFYELIATPKLYETVATEGQAVFGDATDWRTADAKELPSLQDLSQLVWSEASLKESLRKYSVVPIVARRTIQDLRIAQGPYFVPKGSSLLINIQAVHHDPEIWPEPMTFDPKRFLNTQPEPYTFLPFIAGPRNCLGQYLALLESKMVISMLSQRYRFRLLPLNDDDSVDVNDWSRPDKDPRHRFMVPVIPKNELFVQVSRTPKSKQEANN